VLFEEITRQNFDYRGVAYLGRYLCVGNTVGMGKRRGYLVLGAVTHLDEQFPKQLVMCAFLLLFEGSLDLLFGNNLPVEQDLSELKFLFRCYFAHIKFPTCRALSGKALNGLGEFVINLQLRQQSCYLEYFRAIFVEPGQF